MDFFLNIITPSSILVTDLCALNLDDPPLPSLSDLAGAFARNPFSLKIVSDWVVAKLEYASFANYCVCNGSASPCYSIFGRPFASLPDATTNGATVYDLGMKFHCIAACDVTAFAYKDIDPHASASCDFKLWDLTASSLLWTQAHTITSTAYTEVTAATVITLVAGNDYAITFRYGAGWTALFENAGYAGNTNADISSSSRIDNYSAGTGTPTREFSGLAIPIEPIVCPASGPPPAPTVPSQPTDIILPPDWDCATACDIMIRLQQMSERLDWMRSTIDLLQRRLLPFAWILGTAHTGLTGTGVISVQDVLGAVVSMTVPGGWGSTAETPRRLIPSAGSLQGSDGTSYSDNFQLHYEHELIFFGQSWATGIRYNFRPGVTVTLTPLLPEP
jgi:hypothetical protein